jgi:hypothetical protein
MIDSLYFKILKLLFTVLSSSDERLKLKDIFVDWNILEFDKNRGHTVVSSI